MTAFGNYSKDAIVESIKDFIKEKKESNPEIKHSEIIAEIMEVISYGLEHGIYEIENQ